MRTLANLRRWADGVMQRLFLFDVPDDALTAIQQEAIKHNRLASEENCAASHRASAAIDELLRAMEARKHGQT